MGLLDGKKVSAGYGGSARGSGLIKIKVVKHKKSSALKKLSVKKRLDRKNFFW